MTPRKQLINWGLWFSAITGLLLTLIAFRFLKYMPEIDSIKAGVFLITGVFSHFTLISLIFFTLLILPASVLLPSANKVIRQIAIICATTGVILLIADTFVYSQYRFHITGFVFDMLIQGGNDIIAMSWTTWVTIILSLSGAYFIFFRIDKIIWENTHHHILNTSKLKYLLFFFSTLLTSNLIHLWADAQYDQRVTSLVRHIPMFSPATGKEALLNTGLLDAESIRNDRHNFKLSSNTNVVYPKTPIASSLPESPLNILLILLDSARYDVLDERTMPTYHKFSEAPYSHQYTKHISGGNSTRTGVFNLFYGLPGTYWDAFSSTQTSPVLMDTLQKHGYQFGIYAAAPLTQPAFDRTVFSKVENLKLRADGNKPWQLDQNITDNWLKFIEERDQSQPFFGFLFYDGIHGFSVPDEAENPFQPSWDRIDHLSLGPNFDATPYFNLYKNSAYQIDRQLHKVVNQLKDKKLLENTVVIITSDHGQEFNDNKLNYWGHGSNFTTTQVHVPMVIHWPGKDRTTHNHRTSHSDISVTLLQELFSVSTPTEHYSIGHHLNETSRPSWTIAGSYVNYAVLEEDRHIVTYQTGHYEILDNTGRPAKNQDLDTKTTIEVMEALSRFYKN